MQTFLRSEYLRISNSSYNRISRKGWIWLRGSFRFFWVRRRRRSCMPGGKRIWAFTVFKVRLLRKFCPPFYSSLCFIEIACIFLKTSRRGKNSALARLNILKTLRLRPGIWIFFRKSQWLGLLAQVFLLCAGIFQIDWGLLELLSHRCYKKL